MSHLPSIELNHFVRAYESLHDGDLKKIGLQPKLCPAGYWTEGYGSVIAGPDGKMLKYSEKYKTVQDALPFSKIRTECEANADLSKGLEERGHAVLQRLRVPVNQHQFDALVSHAYNCGYSETLYRLINSKAEASKIKEWFTTKYVTAGGVFMLGLQYRRNDEWEIWAGTNYKREYKKSV